MVIRNSLSPATDATMAPERADVLSAELTLAAREELAGATQGGLYHHKGIFPGSHSMNQYRALLPELSLLEPSLSKNVQQSSKLKAAVHASSEAGKRKGASETLRAEEPKLDLRTIHADHAKSDLPTYRWGTVTRSQADEQFRVFESLPQAERAALKSQSICLNVGNALTDYKPELVGKVARGQNHNLEEVEGFYLPTEHSIDLTLHPDLHFGPATILGKGKVSQETHGGNLKHEAGHALDRYFHGFSHSRLFIEAYEADKQALAQQARSNPRTSYDLKYYLHPEVESAGVSAFEINRRQSEIGREELFAEIYSAIRTLPENRTPSERAVAQNFHHVLMVVNQYLQDFNFQEELKFTNR